MIERTTKKMVIFLIILMVPGSILYLYSCTRAGTTGVVAVNFWWGGGDSGEIELPVNESCPVVSTTINAEKLVIEAFNTSGLTVSILVTCESAGTILNQSLVSGEVSGVAFPDVPLTGWVQSQDFVVTAIWEGYNTTVSFNYYTQYVAHSDGCIDYTLPGFYESRNLSLAFLAVGAAVFVLYVIIIPPEFRLEQ